MKSKRYFCDNRNKAIILGIETSCDDTGCAIVDSMGKILGQSLHSQNAIHVKYGGVNPIIAHELHRNNIESVVQECLEKSCMKLSDIDAIAVTTKPGMLISLQVGVKYAKYLARISSKPLIPIHHMEAHALVARMQQDIPFPFLVLLISGGHCLIAVVQDVNKFLLLGQGLDNAPGEVLDKIARRMKLKNIPAYSQLSGGRSIEVAASKSMNHKLFDFPIPLARQRDCNFSFSGLQNAGYRFIMRKESDHGIMGDELIPEINELCAAFQIAITKHITHRTERAIIFCEKNKLISDEIKNIVVSGGVACNNFIFNSVHMIGQQYGYNVHRPPNSLCTDNGVMIAWNGIEKYEKELDIVSDISLKDLAPIAPLGKNIIDQVIMSNLKVSATKLKNIMKI